MASAGPSPRASTWQWHTMCFEEACGGRSPRARWRDAVDPGLPWGRRSQSRGL